MSADRYTVCPVCDYRDPDRDSDDEFIGSVSIYIDWAFDSFNGEISFNCWNCNWNYAITHKTVMPEDI